MSKRLEKLEAGLVVLLAEMRENAEHVQPGDEWFRGFEHASRKYAVRVAELLGQQSEEQSE